MRPIARHPRIALALGLVLGLAAPALAQRGRTVYPDEGVGTTDALVRVRELSEAGNTPEALRVLQKTLEAEGEQLLASPADKDVFIPVRGFIHELLLASPDLLARYRTEQEPAAAKLLEAGKFTEVEQTRLLTSSGFEAVLRLAQIEFEAARFESARLMLQQLERHPDRTKGAGPSADAAKLAGAIAGFLKRADTSAWAQRWAGDAGLSGSVIPAAVPAAPPLSIKTSASPLDNQLPPDLANIPGAPLQSVTLDPARLVDRDGDGVPDDARAFTQRNRTPWIFPTIQGDVVYVNDGERITAWDSATLGQVWQVTPSHTSLAQRQIIEENGFFAGAQPGALPREDAASVTILNGIAIAVTGQPENGMRRGDKRVHAIDAATGKLLWSVDPAFLSPRLENATVRGPVVIDADTVVLALRRTRQFMRGDTSLYQAGLSLYTGNLKWLRLIASVGNQPWGRVSGRPDGAVVHQGVVYRGDEMGLLAAYEAATGRAVWVRLSPGKVFDPTQFRQAENTPPEQMTVPVIDGDALLFVEAPKGRVVRVGLRDGKLEANLEAPRLDNPRYLVKVGGLIAAVNPTKVAFVNPQLDPASISLSNSFAKPGIVGRAEAAGSQLLVPLEGGAALIDPARPADEKRAEFTYSGNLLVAGSGGRTHILAADIARLHTYLEWDQAESLLNSRVAQHPKDPLPLLTYLELASRTGRGERLGELADRTLELLNADPTNPGSLQGRQRLFSLLLEVARNSRFAWATQASPKIPGVAQPLKNLTILDEVVDRMGRAAESPSQQVFTLLEAAWLREKENKPDKAIEAYQQVLTDTSLSAVELDQGARLGAGDAGSASARIETTDRLTALIKRTGPAPYLGYDDEAQRALAELEGAPPERLAALARSYPVAAVTPEAWNRASAGFAQAGRMSEARLAAGAGLSAAELGAAIGREGQLDMLGKLSGSLLALSGSTTDAEPAFRLMRRLSHDHPTISVTWEASKVTPGEAADRLHARLMDRTGLPIIGSRVSHNVQVIENWEPADPLVRGAPGFSGDTTIMVNESVKQVALWGVGAEDGRLHQLWTRPYQIRPIVIRVLPDTTLLFWPTATGGAIEALGLDGASLWRTHEFATLFGGAEAPDPRNPQMPPDRINTPLDGPVRPEDLMVTSDGKMLVLVQRRGRAGAFDLADGHLLWSKPLEQITRAYDVEQAGDCIVISGAGSPGRGPDKTGSLLIALDKKTGALKSRLDQTTLGDHARWCRAVGKDMVVATSEGLFRYDPATGKVAWNMAGPPGRGSFAGWVVGEGLFVLDSEVNLWHVSLRDGKASAAPLDSRNRINFPVTAVVMGKTLAVSSTQGLVVFAENGDVMGADGLDGQGSIQTPVPSESMFVAVENNQHDDSDQGIVSKLFLFSHPSGKLVTTERIRLFENPRMTTVLDGKILVCEGPVTLVLDAPAESKP